MRLAKLLAFVLVSSAAAASAQRGTIPVNIASTPAGAAVFVDSVDTPSIGTTPLRRVRIARGSHTLIFRLENHEEARLQVNIRRWNESFEQALNALGVINVTAGTADTASAEVRIDGVPSGVVPMQQTVQPGRHLIQVGREGFVTFTQWVELSGGQVLQLPVTLQREAPQTGSLLVSSDLSGASVIIDGTERGTTPTVIEGLSAGPHRIEVRPPASESGMSSFEETVTIAVGERAVLAATLRPAPPTGGSLRILANATGAIIRLDGEVLGEAPATADNVTPGDHIVEAAAEGFQPLQQPVAVEAGQQRVLALELQAVERAPGQVIVNADVEGATVMVDNEDRGTPPVVIEEIAAGTHSIIVTAAGRTTFRTTCTTAPGENCTVNATLAAAPVDIRVSANVPGAVLLVDGEEIGPVPFEGTVPAGSHRIEVRADGYRAHTEQTVLQAGGEARLFDVQLVGEDELSPEELAEESVMQERRHRQAVARGGATLDDDFAILDFSIGWPYIFEGRLGIGILPWLEAGVGLRTFVRLTEFEARVKAGTRIVPQFSAGVQVRLGGGIGPTRDATDAEQAEALAMGTEAPSHSTNSFFMSIEALGTLHFNNAGNFTLWTALDFHSDRWDWQGRNNDCRYSSGCIGDDGNMPSDPMAERIDGRQNIARFRIGGSLEFIVARNWNVWGAFEGVFGVDRRVLGDVFGGDHPDLEIYPRIGLTYKFDYVDRD